MLQKDKIRFVLTWAKGKPVKALKVGDQYILSGLRFSNNIKDAFLFPLYITTSSQAVSFMDSTFFKYLKICLKDNEIPPH